MEKLEQKDRVHLSLGVKVQIKQFEPFDITAGIASDVMEGETLEEAQDRVEKAVMSYLEARFKAVKDKVTKIKSQI